MEISNGLPLPAEIFLEIFRGMPLSEIARCREVCRQWRAMINQMPSLLRFERSWSVLRPAIKGGLSIPLPRTLYINPVKVFPFNGGWVLETLGQSSENNCYFLPDIYLGRGNLSLKGSTLFRRERNCLHLYTGFRHKKIGVAVAEIGEKSHLIITPVRTAAVFQNNGTFIFSVTNVGKARFARNKLLVHEAPNTTLLGFNLNRNLIFSVEAVKWFDLTKRGEIVYQVGTQLYLGDKVIYDLGDKSISRLKDHYVFLQDKNDGLSALSLADRSETKVKFPPQINQENCVAIEFMPNCTVFVAHNKPTDPTITTIVIQRNPQAESDPLDDIRVELPRERDLCFSDGFIWILGPRGLVYDVTKGHLISIFPGLSSDSSTFRDSFISGKHLVCVQDDALFLWTIEKTMIVDSARFAI